MNMFPSYLIDYSRQLQHFPFNPGNENSEAFVSSDSGTEYSGGSNCVSASCSVFMLNGKTSDRTDFPGNQYYVSYPHRMLKRFSEPDFLEIRCLGHINLKSCGSKFISETIEIQ